MSIQYTFQHLYQLLDQLAPTDEQTSLVEQIRNELHSLENQLASQEQVSPSAQTESQLILDPTTKCYTIEGQSVFYCPHCYEKDKSLAPAQRINRKLRVCTQCRSSIRL